MIGSGTKAGSDGVYRVCQGTGFTGLGLGFAQDADK